jgi:hypothetical protein
MSVALPRIAPHVQAYRIDKDRLVCAALLAGARLIASRLIDGRRMLD